MQFFDNLFEDKYLKKSFVITFFMCLAAHGYAYMRSIFLGDRTVYYVNLRFFIPSGARFGAQLVPLSTLNMHLPWLRGILACIFFSFATYITCKVLDIKKTLSIFLIAGIIVTNDSVIGAHMYDPSTMAAIPLAIACFSVLSWYQENWKIVKRIVIGAICIAFSLSIYGAYTTYAPTLVLLCLLFMLLNGKEAKYIVHRGLEYLGTFIAGMGVYYLLVRLTLVFTGSTISSYMNEDKLLTGAPPVEILTYFVSAYKKVFQRFTGIYVHWHPYRPLPWWWATSMLALGIGLLVIYVLNKKVLSKAGNKPLILLILVLFPLSAASIYVLAFNTVHWNMLFSFCAIYIAHVKMAEQVLLDTDLGKASKKISSVMAAVLIVAVAIFVHKEVAIANLANVRLEDNYTATINMANRVISRIEGCEGFTGEEYGTIWVGALNDSEYFKKFSVEGRGFLPLLDGLNFVEDQYNMSIVYADNMFDFMPEVLHFSLSMGKYAPNAYLLTEEDREVVKNMPLYPADGSVRKFGDYIVVKFIELDEY